MTESKLLFPFSNQKLLLHSCCAPCSGDILETLISNQVDTTIFFYNPNIYPKSEYIRRKNEIKTFADQKNISFIDSDYDAETWTTEMHGLEQEPERGARCSKCFFMRLKKTVQYASAHHFPNIATTLGISRWKDMDQVNQCGEEAIKNYPEINFWNFNWRKAGGSQRMYDVAKRENFYKQEYCGCISSLNLQNALRKEKGQAPIAHSSFYE